jgi:tripartite-type tricarboxylate transporter receptor subunit TctC
MRPLRRQMLGLPLLGLAARRAAAQPARGAAWPDRPIRLVVGYPAGGPTDFAARILQEPLQQLWGQPLVIENRPGASSVLATELVARAPADGYTLLLGASVHASNPAVYPRLPYDSVRDFAPIVLIYSSPTVLFAAPDGPLRTTADVLAAARATPGLTYGTSGNGSSGHFAGAFLSRKAGIELTHVAYRGAVPALQDVMTGRVPLSLATLSGALALVRDGKLRPVAICGPQRVAVLPEVPTLDEAGVGIPDTSPWYGFIGPAGIPAPVVQRIAADVQALLRRPEIARRITDQGGVVGGEGPEELAARLLREMAESAEIARSAQIRPD